MKKLFTLIALCLFTVVGAKADVTTLYERGVETAWTAADVTAWGADDFDAATGLHKTGGNGSNAATLNINPAANSIIDIEAYWIGMSNTGRSWADSDKNRQNNCSYFRYANTWVCENDQDKQSAYFLGESFSYLTKVTFTNPTGRADRTYDPKTGAWYVVKMQINTATNKLVYLTVESSDKLGTKLVNIADQTLTNADYTKVIFGYIKSGSVSNSNNEYLKSIVITQTTQAVATADYTINYKFEGNTIKTVNGNTVVGDIVNAESPITINEQKYYAVNGANLSMTIDAEAANNVLDVNLRKANEWNWTVKSSLNTTLANGVCVEGNDFTVALPRYILSDGTLYETAKGSDWYHKTYSITQDNQVETVTYNATPITNVVFYAEAEDLAGATSGGSLSSRTSMGLTAYGTNLPVTNLAPGKYKIYMHGANGNLAARAVAFKNGETPVAEFSIVGNNNTQDFISPEFTIASAADITLTSEGSSTSGVDYIYIVKTGDVCPVTSYGYATFSTPYAVDLDNLTDGYTAYVATATTSETVTIEPASGVVPANTGLIIKGAEGTCAIPVSAEVGIAPAPNFLMAVTADNTQVSGADKYVLGVDGGVVKFLQCDKNTATLNAGKAYLSVTPGAKALRFVVGGTTGIENVASAKATNKAVKRIMNGQLVIEKAGKMFNAAGAEVK